MGHPAGTGRRLVAPTRGPRRAPKRA